MAPMGKFKKKFKLS